MSTSLFKGCSSIASMPACSNRRARKQLLKVPSKFLDSLKFQDSRGIEAVVAAMKAHKTCVLVQEQACGALRNLVCNYGNQVKIAEAGGSEA